MNWTEKHIANHLEAAKILHKIMQESFEFISKNRNASEFDVQKFILKKFKENKIKSKMGLPIVAFNENSALPHYQPTKKSKKIKPETFILIDIWGRLEKKSSPYADITWVAYYGASVPKQIKEVFTLALESRDRAISVIKSNLNNEVLPTGKEIHEKVSELIVTEGYKENILHGTGHTIGFRSPHGKGNDVHLNKKGQRVIQTNIGYAIEPGIYLKDEFGIRSEINCYIDKNKNLHITTKLQKEMIFLKPL
ncbi:MAG: hypothetical protein UT41_C0008G0003 [Candidatus Wolfebacteria bacterium GW2011_GWC2_39_22]|uniref:Peptidase M24 domain-containing protein n=1 Tax=Candidatus Wolfebacteria bacterium GW2011_GWC2_39_22 TaxID=1619013 RepID=A0A0G0QMP5_9BACT|nr:MAG: hypothetical protein UT41_C0008G0003 [Candidatus Wolfebacteria bacterium GW2011_GWC2_39_22]